MRILLATHALLLLLASTDFTIVTALSGGRPWQWCYFSYASKNGFGYQFQSDYTVLAIATYLLAFLVGLAGFLLASRAGHKLAGGLGAVLSVLGLISFTVESSHWLLDHHRSWIAISPAIMFALVLWILVQEFLRNHRADAGVESTEIGPRQPLEAG